jgi:uncharacterized protein (DUF1330 family)
MSAYVFFDVREISDAKTLEQYRNRVLETVTAHGGRYLVLGGHVEGIEGSWKPNVPVLIQFAALDAARRWYGSDEYAPLKALRLSAARGDAVLMQSPLSDFVRS